MFTCRPIPGWLENGDGNEVREEGRQQKKKKKKVKNSAPIFLQRFAPNPFSTTSCALAQKGAETQKWKRKQKKKEAKLRSKAPGQRVSMRSV